MGQVDRAHPGLLVADGSDQQGGRRHGGQEIRHVQGSQVAGYIRDPQGLLQAAEVLEEPQPFRHVPQPLVLFLRQAGDDEVRQVPGFVENGDGRVA